MIDKQQLIQDLIKNGGKCTNLSRSIQSRYPELYQWIMDSTKFLDNKQNLKINERVYCAANGITDRPLNNFGEFAVFRNIFIGYCYRESSKAANEIALKKLEEQANKRAIRQSIKDSAPILTETERKIKDSMTRSQRINPEIYAPDAVEFEDYVECPVSHIRFKKIRDSHITSTLGMTLEDFDALYPNFPKSSNKHKLDIRQKLATVDEETGKTIHQLAHERAQETLRTVDENGISGYQKIGVKTRETHMSNIDENGKNGYHRIAVNAIIVGNQTKVKKGIIIDPASRDEYYRYKNIITRLTEDQRKTLSRGHKTGLAGEINAMHIDHMYSIYMGYNNKVSPLLIGNIHNLRMIAWDVNVSKHTKSSITIEELLQKTSYTLEQSLAEYEYFMDKIRTDIMENRGSYASAMLQEFYESNLFTKQRL